MVLCLENKFYDITKDATFFFFINKIKPVKGRINNQMVSSLTNSAHKNRSNQGNLNYRNHKTTEISLI